MPLHQAKLSFGLIPKSSGVPPPLLISPPLPKRLGSPSSESPPAKRATTIHPYPITRQIFLFLKSKAAAYTKGTQNYKAFFDKYDTEMLVNLLCQESASVALDMVEKGTIRSKDQYEGIPGGENVTLHNKPGIYVCVVSDRDNTDQWWVYTGQSVDIADRRRRELKDSKNPTKSVLFFRVWRAENTNRWAEWYRVGDLSATMFTNSPETLHIGDLSAWLNLCEMFWSVAFQTFPSGKKDWYPNHLPKLNDIGLNSQLPLSQGTRKGLKFGSLANSDNTVIRDIYRKQLSDNGKITTAIHQADDYDVLQRANQKASANVGHYKEAHELGPGEVTEYLGECKRCQAQMVMKNARWFKHPYNTLFIASSKRCQNCKNHGHSTTIFYPMDKNLRAKMTQSDPFLKAQRNKVQNARRAAKKQRKHA